MFLLHRGALTVADYRKLFDLTGKIAAVLGAASGIGKSLAEVPASLGASVMCADCAGEGTEATAAAIRVHGGFAEPSTFEGANSPDFAPLAPYYPANCTA